MRSFNSLLIVIALFFAISTTATASTWRELNSWADDNSVDGYMHSAVGLASGGYVANRLKYKPIYVQLPASVCAAILIGCIKELTDKNFNIHDVKEYGYGALVAVPLINITW
jgi:hypothetical protein